MTKLAKTVNEELSEEDKDTEFAGWLKENSQQRC